MESDALRIVQRPRDASAPYAIGDEPFCLPNPPSVSGRFTDLFEELRGTSVLPTTSLPAIEGGGRQIESGEVSARTE